MLKNKPKVAKMLDFSKETLFFSAIAQGSTNQVYQMLVTDPGLANSISNTSYQALAFTLSQKNSISALMLAASLGYNDIIDILVKFNANLNFQNEEGQSALLEAVRFGKQHTVDHLVHYYGASLNQTNTHGLNALMTALWAMQPEMALFLVTHYMKEIDLQKRSNNAFKKTIAMLYQLETNQEEAALKIYSSNDSSSYDQGYDILELIKERWRQKRSSFKETLMRMIVNQEEERTSSATVAFFRSLRIKLQNKPSTEVLSEVVEAVLGCDLFLTQSKKYLKDELSELIGYEQLEKIFILSQTLQAPLNADRLDLAINQIIKLDLKDLAIIIHWPNIATLLASLKNQEVNRKIFEYAIAHQSVDVLAKLISAGIVSVSEVMSKLSEPEDLTEDEMAFYYLSLTLANTPDANIVVAENFDFFVKYIKNTSNGFYSDLAQWLIIHHQMFELPSSSSTQDVPEEQKFNHLRIVFSQLLKLSDRDPAKIVMLRRFAEAIMQKGAGMKGDFTHVATPFMLLFEMFGEKAFTTPDHDLAFIDTSSLETRTYLPSMEITPNPTLTEFNADQTKPATKNRK